MIDERELQEVLLQIIRSIEKADRRVSRVERFEIVEASVASGAPKGGAYLTLAPDATLTDERVFQAGSGLQLTDQGAGASAWLDVGPGVGIGVTATTVFAIASDIGASLNANYGPASGTYVTLSTHADLTSERVLKGGSGILLTDNGAGNFVWVDMREGVGLTISGSNLVVNAGSGLEFDGDALTVASNLYDLSGLDPADSNFIVGEGGSWIVESGNTARTSLGLGTGDTASFAGLTVDQTGTASAIPVALFNQHDISEPAILVSYADVDNNMVIMKLEHSGSPQFSWSTSASEFVLNKTLRITGAIDPSDEATSWTNLSGDERSQDAVGGILTDTATIEWTYDDATPQITACAVAVAAGAADLKFQGFANNLTSFTFDSTDPSTIGSASISASTTSGCLFVLGTGIGFIRGHSGSANWELYIAASGATTNSIGQFNHPGTDAFETTVTGFHYYNSLTPGSVLISLQARKWSTGGSLTFGSGEAKLFLVEVV